MLDQSTRARGRNRIVNFALNADALRSKPSTDRCDNRVANGHTRNEFQSRANSTTNMRLHGEIHVFALISKTHLADDLFDILVACKI